MISVICPVYNCAQYIKVLIDSVIAQSFCDWELILVDDGSTDSSGIICDEYSYIDKRIRVIHKKNEGVSSARNAGIVSSLGDFLYFVDSDDELLPDGLSVLVEHMGPKIDLVTGSYERYVNGILVPERVSREDFSIGPKAYLDVITTFPNAHFCERYIWTKLFRTSIVKEKSVHFDVNLFYGEDVHFLFQYLVSCKKDHTIIGIDRIVYRYYRRNDGAASRNTLNLTPYSLDMFLGSEKRLKLIQSFASPVAIINQKRELIGAYHLFMRLLCKDDRRNVLRRVRFFFRLNYRLAKSLTAKEYIVFSFKSILGQPYNRIKRKLNKLIYRQTKTGE